MVSTRKVVPPTPYYYGVRAEWHLREAERAHAKGDIASYDNHISRFYEFRLLAGQLEMEMPHAI